MKTQLTNFGPQNVLEMLVYDPKKSPEKKHSYNVRYWFHPPKNVRGTAHMPLLFSGKIDANTTNKLWSPK